MAWIELNATTPAPPAGSANVHFRKGTQSGTQADPIKTTAHVLPATESAPGLLPILSGNPDEFLNGDGDFTAISDVGTSHELVFALLGKPASVTTYPWYQATRTVNYAANFSGSSGSCGTNPNATATFTVKQNGTTIGTIEVATGGTVTFATTGGTSKTLSSGDRVTLVSPTQDGTLESIAFTLKGTKG